MKHMVEKTKDKKTKEQLIDFCINASDVTDITLTEEESEKLLDRLKRGPNEKAIKFSKEALNFYEENEKKVKDYLTRK